AAVPRLRDLRAERGEGYALFLALGFAHGLAVATGDLLVLAVALVLSSTVTAAYAAIDRDAPRGAEAAVKEIKAAGYSFALLAFAAALTYGAGGRARWHDLALQQEDAAGLIAATCALVVVLIRVMATPVNMPALDVAQGAPPFAGGVCRDRKST